MTTENVAVLFTDMVGSTALSGMSPDVADELRASISIMWRAIAEAGGTEVKIRVMASWWQVGVGVAVVRGRDATGIERNNHSRDQAVGLRAGSAW